MFPFLRKFSDETTACSYLPLQTARLPMSLPIAAVEPESFDQLMASGYRRSGRFYYDTQCPCCRACEPVRVEVSRFQPNRSQRRVLSRASALRVELNQPTVDSVRVDLFNRHRTVRKLARDSVPVSTADYTYFLMQAANPTIELSVWYQETLLAVSITDIGFDCLSAVYCFFDPQYSHLSLGTLCVLKQVQLAQQNQITWLYLGFYVANNAHLSYKSNFKPHQRRIDGVWQDFS